ncbi:MAG TPA: hypothetical protein VGD88_08845 [Opitutaceae bacterium]
MKLRSRSILSLCALLAALAAAGCSTSRITVDGIEAQPFIPVNHMGVERLPEDLRRVVVLPASGGTDALDAVLVAALQRRNRFEVVAISRVECMRRFRREDFSSVSALPPGFLQSIAREWAADAVMFIDVTTERTVRPLALGLRAKLASVEDMRLLWTFDNVFSLAEPAVAAAARRHYLAGERAGELADRSAAVFQSPRRFAAYAADSTFATLPPR